MGDRKTSSGSGNAKISDAINEVRSLGKEVNSFIKEISGKMATFGVELEDDASEAMKKVEQEYDDLQKETKKPIQISIEDKDIFDSDRVSGRIAEIKTKLERSLEKINGGDKLSKKQAEMYIREYLELERYMDRMQGQVETRFSDMYKNIVESIKARNNGSIIELLSTSDFKELTQGVNSGFAKAAKQSFDRNWNAVRRSLSKEANAGNAEEQIQYVQSIKDQINALSQEAENLQNTMSQLFYTEVDKDGTIEYFDEELQKMEDVRKKANELRSALSEIEVPRGNSDLKDSINDSLQVLSGIQRDSSGRKDTLQAARNERQQRIQEEAAELERAAQRRADAVKSLIIGDANYEEFGNQRMLDSAMEEARQAEDNASAIQEIYQRVSQKLLEAKQQKDLAEQQRQQLEESREKTKRNRQRLDEFFEGLAGGDSKKLRQYRSDYADYYNKLINPEEDIDDIIAAISAKLGLLRSGGTGGGTGTGTGTGFTDSFESQMEEEGEKTRETGRQAREAWEEAEKEYESIGNIKERIRQKYQESRTTIHNDSDYYNANPVGVDDIDNSKNRLSELTRILENLQEKREDYQRDLENAQKEYSRYSSEKDDYGVETYASNIEEYYKNILKYDDLISYIQKELNSELTNFKPGDTWGTQEINFLIETLKQLVREIQKVSSALGTIDDESGISSLLSQFKDFGETIDSIFNTDNIEEFKDSIQGLSTILERISESIGVIGEGTNRSARNNKKSIRQMVQEGNKITKDKKFGLDFNIKEDSSLEAEQMKAQAEIRWKSERERYKVALDKLKKTASDVTGMDDGEYALFSGLVNSNNAVANRYQGDLSGVFGSAVISNMQNPEEVVQRIMDFFSIVNSTIEQYRELIPEKTAIKKNMKTGDTGASVKKLQRKLKLQADTLGDLYDIDISGKFDDETKNAVMDFQKRFNIKGAIGEVNQVFMDTLDGLFDAERNPLLEEISKISLPSDNMKNLNKVISEIYDVARAPGEKKSAMEKLADTLKGLGVTPDIEGQNLENYQFEQTINDLKESFIGLQTIVKNGFGLTEIEGEEGKFTSFLSELVSKMEEVRKSAGEMASSLSGALKEIGGADGDNLSKRIQDQIESGNPYEIEIEPKNTLVDAIQKMLDGADFEIDIKPNMNGKDSPAELITQMVGADAVMGLVGGKSALRERGMAFNSKTGYHTNPFIFDNNDTFSGILTDTIMSNVSEEVDTWMHTHPELYPAFSLSNKKGNRYSGDLRAAYTAYKNKGINTEINAAQNQVAIFDAKKFYDMYGDLFNDDNIESTMESIYKARQDVEENFKKSFKSISDVFNIELFDIPIDQLIGKNFDLPELAPRFKEMMAQVWKNVAGDFDSTSFTNDFIKYIDNLPQDYGKTIREVFIEYLSKSFSDFNINPNEIEQYLGDGSDFKTAIGVSFEHWFNNLMESDIYKPRIQQLMTPEILQKSLGIADFNKNFMQYLTIDQFKQAYGTATGRTDPYSSISASAIRAASAKQDFTGANKDAADSVDPTVDKLKEEDLEFNEIQDSAKEAASSKKDFVKANEDVADTNKDSISKEIENRKQRIAELQRQLDDYSDAMREFDRKAKGDGDEYHRLQEEYLSQHKINPTYIRQEIEQLNNEIKDYEKKMQDTAKLSSESPILSGTTTLSEQEQATGQAAEQMGQNIADGANTGNEAVQRLSESLTELFKRMQNSPKEILAMFGDGGIVGDIIGRESAVNPEETYRLMVSNISKNIFGSLHNHPNLQNVLSADDFNGLLADSGLYENGMRLSGVLSGDKVKFYDFSDIAKDQMQAFLVNYKEQMSIVRDEVAKQFGAQSFKTMDLNLARSKEFREAMNQRELELEGQLLQEGIQSGLFKTNPMKEFDVSDVQGIAQYLLQIQERATAALSPMQQLINLVEFGSEKKLDLGSQEVKAILDAFSSGNISGLQAFDKLMNTIGGAPFKLSNETPVSSSEEEVTTAADAHKKAAAAAEEHAAAAREANNEEANTQPSPIDERNDFIQRSKQIFDEFGMSQHDIPVEWQAFLNNIANDGMKADDALEALRATLDAIGDQKPPEYFGGEEANKSNDSIYIKQDVNDYDDEDYSYTEWLGYAQQRLVKRKRRYDEDGTPAEDEFGNPLYDESSKTFTNFKQIEQEVINVDKVILKLWADLEKGEELHKPTKAIRELLAYAGDYSRELTQELDKYYQEAGYFPGHKQVQDFMKRRKQSNLQVSANLQRSADEEAYKEQQKLNKAIEDTNALIEKQQGNLDSLKRKYVSGAGVEFSEKDKDRLIKQEQEIQKIFDRIRGRKTSKTEKEEIDNALKKYRDIAQESVKHQKAATKLDADRPDVARDRLIADIDDLLGKMKDSGADTSKQQERLRGILKLLQDQFDLVSDPASWIKQRGQDYKKVREENRAIQNEYEREEKSTNRYAELTMKKARETNLEADEQQELDQLTQRYEILNGLKEAGFQLSSNELAIIERVAQADKAAMEERIRLQEELQESIKEYDYEQERKAAIEKDEQDRKGMKEQDIANQDSLKQAQKALTDYENAVKNLVKAQTEFDLGDQKDPKIVKNLEDAKQAVEETKYALMGLAKVFDEEFVDKDVKNEAKNRLAEALRLERNPSLSEDYRSALYKQNKKEEEARQKEAAVQQKMADKEQVAQIRNTYKENLDIIKQYHEALKELNFLEEKSKIDPSVKGTERFKELTEQVAKLKEEAKEAMDVIDQLQMEGVLRDGQHANAKTMYDNAGTLKATQQDQLNNLMNRKLKSDLFSQINEQLDIIKNAYDLQTRKNLSDTAQLRGGSTGENIQKLTDECKEAAEAAEKAKQEIENLLSISGDILGADEIEAITKRTNREFDKSKKGSASSARSLSNARKAQRSQEVRTELEEYNKAMQEYSSLYEKSITGTLTADENERMANSLKTIIQLEENWNKEKAENIKLTERQKDLRDMLDNASKQYGDDGKHDEKYTKEMLETNVLQDRAVNQYDALMRKLTKMYDQSSWREGGWDDKVSGLIAELKTYNPNDVFDKTSLDEFIQKLQKIRADAQEVSKSIDFRPVKETWQTKTTSGLQKWMDQNKIAAKKYEDDIKQIFEDINKVVTEGEAADIENRINKIQGEAAEKGLLGKSLGDRFKDQFKNTMTSLATYYLSFQDFIRYGRQAISIITELDTQLTEMRKVSDESLQTLQDYQLETFDIASRVGTTAAQIQSSTADWMRLGETLSEAKKSAEYSTLLLNVSEFSDINTATESLVAMSQAYQDIDKLDIIDKLNNIGNNFSISTSDLASSLQLSAGTLKVAGNSLDEAVALTVAGNQVLQDPQKVGQSLRTISLRLTGTSVEDMQEAGEEIDGLITTQSKLRKTIMDITKVSSNGFKGFDILNESGNYKSTYEMLKGIAEVWKEIGEEDKKMGSNRQSLLLETIAGKTRAAAASSILDNFETLQDVYEASLNSQGSAQAELDKYLDSIQGKAAQFQNELQKLASSAIDSSWIKGFIDLGTQLLGVINKLGSAFGHLNTLIGTAAGIFLQFNGKGIFNYDKILNNWELGGMAKLPSFFKGIFTGKNTEVTKVVSNEISDTMRNAFDMLEPDELFTKQIGESALSGFISDIGDSNFEKFLAQMDEAKLKGMSAKEVFDEFANSTHEVVESVSMGSKVFSGLLHGITSIGSYLLTITATIVAVTAAMSFLEYVYNNLPSVKRKHDIETGKAATESIKQINEEYENREKSTKELGERYNELRSGVSYDNGKGYSNISLSTEEFEEFLNVNNQIAALYPQLRAGTDAQGNAYVNLGANADKATQSLNNLLNAQRDLANKEIGEKFQDQLTGVLAQNSVELDNISENEWLAGSVQANLDATQNGIESFIEEVDGGYKVVIDQSQDYGGKISDAFEKGFYSNGINLYDQWMTGGGLDENGHYIAPTITYFFEADTESLDAAIAETNKLIGDTNGGEYDQARAANDTIAISQRQIDDNWESLKPSLMAKFTTTKTYKDFSETIQNGITQAISNIDLGDAYKAFENQDIFGKFDDYLKNKLMYSLSGVYDRAKTEEDKKQASQLIESLFTFDPSNLTDSEMTSKLDDILEKLFPGDEELQHTFKVALKYEVVDDDGNYSALYEDINNRIYEALGGEDESKIAKEKLSELKQNQKESIINAIDNDAFDFELGGGFDELLEWIDRYQNKLADIKPDGILSDIFKNESYQSNVEGYEKSLSSLTSALETLRTEGSLTSEQMRDLQEEFPSLTDFTSEGLQKAGTKYLSNWISEFKSGWTDFSDEGQKQLDTYLANFTASYRKIAVDAQEVRTAVRESIASNYGISIADTNNSKYGMIDYQYDNMINAIKEKFPNEEVNMSIVLALKDYASGDLEAFVDKYQDYKLIWDLEVHMEDVQKDIDNLNNRRDMNSAKQSKWEAYGFNKSASYYDEDNSISQQLINDYMEQIRIAEQDIQNNPEDEKLVETAKQKIAELRRQILSEETTQIENEKAKNQLPLTQIQNARDEVSRQIESINSDISLSESTGELTSESQYQSLIDATQNDNELLEQEETILQARINIMEGIAKLFKQDLSNNTEYLNLQSQLATNRKEQIENQKQIFDYEKSIRQLPLTRLQNERAQLTRNTTASNKVISDKKNAGLEVTKADYEQAIRDTAEERFNLFGQRNDIQSQIDDMIAKEEAMIEASGGTGDALEALANNTEFQGLQTDLENVNNEINSMDESIIQLTTDMNNIKMDKLKAEFSNLERDMEKIQRNLDDTKTENTAKDYVSAISKNFEQQANLRDQIVEKQKEFYKVQHSSDGGSYRISELPKTSEKYQTWASELAELESQLYNTTSANDAFVESLLSLPVTKIDEAIQGYQRELENLESKQNVNAAKGISMSEEDYAKNIATQRNINGKYLAGAGLNNLLASIYGLAGDEGRRKQFEQAAHEDMQSYYSGVAETINMEKAKREIPVTINQQYLDNLQREGEILQSTFDQLESQGKEITEESYSGILGNLDEQIAKQKEVANGWLSLRDSISMTNEDGSLNTDWAEYDQNYTSALTALDGLNTKQLELNETVAALPLTKLQNELTDLQTDATAIQDLMTIENAKGLKATVKQYQKLSKNSKDQIKNLKQQNQELAKQSIGLDKNGSKYREIADTIRSNASTIKGLEADIIDYDSQARRLVTTQAQDLASAISSALSEMGSGTGLSNDTIDSLMIGFSDIAGKDVSNMFYRTAEGIKVDVRELERLARAENEVKNTQLANDIEEKRAAIAAYENQIGQGKSNETLKRMNSELQDLLRQQSEYFATYAEQMEKLSKLNQISLADATENQGANYDTSKGYLEGAKEMWDKGLIGTDDFKARAAYFNAWGFDDPESFKADYDKIAKYMTDDISGIDSFMNDLVSEGLAYVDEETKGIIVNFTDLKDAAMQFKGGVGSEWFRNMFGKVEEYGGIFSFISSEEEAILKTEELQNQLTDAKLKKADLISAGADADVLQKQQDVIDQVEARLKDVNTATENYREGLKEDYKSGFENIEQTVDYLSDAYNDATDEISKNRIKDQIQDIADEYDLKLNFNLETGEISIDEQSYEEAEKEMYTTADRLSKYGEGGNVDLLHRPQINAKRLTEAGYDNAGEGFATVFTHTFSNEEGNIAMNFTPILPDGTVMEKGEFEKYCEEVASGVHEDTLGLKIGATFEGENAIEDAVQTAEKIHELQEDYYPEMEIKTPETALSAADVGVGIERASEFEQLLNDVYEAGESSDQQVQKALGTLSKYTAEQLKSINLSDRQYDGTFEGATEAEMAMDALNAALGNTGDNAQLLSYVLESLGYVHSEIDVDSSDVDEAEEKVNKLNKDTEKPLKKKLNVEVTDTGTGTPLYETNRIKMAEQNRSAYAEELEYTNQQIKYNENADNQQPTVDAIGLVESAITEVGTTVSSISENVSGLAGDIGEAVANAISGGNNPEGNPSILPDGLVQSDTSYQQPSSIGFDAFNGGISNQAFSDQVVRIHGQLDTSEVPEEVDVMAQFISDTQQVDADKAEIESNPVEQQVEFVGLPGSTNLPKQSSQTIETKEEVTKDEVTNQTTNIKVNNEEAMQAIKEVSDGLTDLQNQQTQPIIDADNSQAINKIISTSTQLSTLSSKTATPSITLENVDTTLDQLTNIKNKLDQIKSKTVTITISQTSVGGGLAGGGGHVDPNGYTGTAIKPFGKAYVSGNLPEKDLDLLPNIPITEQLHFGNGDVGLPTDEEALVNELGTESIIRDGHWFTIPGGMHVEKLKKGDVILNHKQTDDLIKSGKALGHGKAYAQGTAINGMPAHAVTGVVGGYGGPQGGAAKSGGDSGNNGDTEATKKHTDAMDSDTKSTQKSTDAKKKEIKVYDWVERRLKYFADKTEEIADRITDYVTKAFKTINLKREMSSVNREMNANIKAAPIYYERAEQKADSFDYYDSNGAKQTVTVPEKYRKLVRQGKIHVAKDSIEDMDISSDEAKGLSEAIDEYQQWIDKAKDAEKNARQLSNTWMELYEDFVNVPLEYAEKAVEKIDSSMSNRSAVEDVLSSYGNTGARMMRKYGYTNEASEKTVKKMKGKRVYQVQDKLMENNFKDQEKIVKENRTATKQAQAEANKQAKRLKAVSNRMGLNISTLLYEEATQAKGKKSKNSSKGTDKMNKALSSGNILNNALKEAISKNEMIDVTKLKLTGEALKQAQKYNKVLQQSKIAQKTATEATQKSVESEAELAKMRVENAKKGFENVKQYYESRYSAQKTVDEKQNARAELKNVNNYMSSNEYKVKNKNEQQERNIQINERNALIKRRNNLVKKGDIRVNDDTWREMTEQINSLDTAILNSRQSSVELFKEWVNSPLEKAAEAIEKLKNKFEALGGAMNAAKSGLSAVNAFLNMVTSSLAKNARQVLTNTKGQKSYVAQNKLLDKELANQEQQVKRDEEALDSAQKNLNTANKQKEKADKNVTDKKNTLSKYSKKLTKKQKQQLAQGKAVDTKGVTDKKALKAIEDYNDALDKRAEKINNVKNAQDAVETANKNLLNDQMEYANAYVQNEIEKFNNIKDFYSSLRERQNTESENMEKQYAFKEAHGEYKIMEEFDEKIKNRRKDIATMKEQRAELIKQLNDSVKSEKIKEGSDEWKAMQHEIDLVTGDIGDAEIEVENLTQQQIDLHYDELFERAAKKADLFIDRLQTIVGLVSDDMMFDNDGLLTEYGALALQENAAALNENIKNLQTYMKERKQIQDDYYIYHKYGQEKFDELMAQNQKNLEDSLKNANTYRQAILDIIKKQSEEEVKAINKVIDKRKEALQKKKDYYDWDKTLKGKTKDIQQLEAQIAALSGVETAEAKSKRAKLQEELSNANEDLEDTIRDHVYETQVEGLDKMSEQLNENLEKWIKELALNLDKASDVITEAINNSSSPAALASALGSILGQFGINPSTLEGIGFSLKTENYATGTRRIKKQTLANTNEKGREIIVTKSGVLTQLEPGDGVVPNKLTENFFEAAKNYPMMMNTIQQLVNGYNLMSQIKDNIPYNNSGSVEVHQHYDSLINIQGNADSATVEDLKKFSKEFLEKSYEYTSRRINQDYRRTGGLRKV